MFQHKILFVERQPALLELMDVANIIPIMCLLDHRVSQIESGAFK